MERTWVSTTGEMMCDGEYNIQAIKYTGGRVGIISTDELFKRIENAKRYNTSSIKRIDGRHGCNGCYLYTHYVDEYKSCHYCKKPLKYPSIDTHKQFITFNYTIIDDPNVQPMNCPYPERWEND